MRKLWTVFSLVMVAATGWFAWRQIAPRMEGWVVWVLVLFAVLGVLLLLAAVGSLVRGAVMGRLIKRSLSGRWRDGQRVLVTGQVTSGAEPLAAPFSGASCVAYEYRVYRRVVTTSREEDGGTRRRTHKETAAFGFAQRPFVLRASGGDVRVCGVALLDALDEYCPADAEALERGRSLLTTEDEVTIFDGLPFKLITTLAGTLKDDVADVEHRWRRRDAPSDPQGWLLGEKCLMKGDTVSVIGAWDHLDRTVRPSGGDALELVRGGIEEARKHWVGGSRVSAGLSVLFGVLFLGMVWLFWWGAGREGPETPGDKPDLVLDGGVPEIERRLAEGADPNARDTFGTPLLFTTRDPDAVRALLNGGADPDIRNKDGTTRLQIAALRDETGIVRALLDAEANLELADERGETPALAALRGGRWGIFDELMAAGARDPCVRREDGRRLQESDVPYQSIVQFIEAVLQKDRDAIVRYVGPEKAEGADLEIWARARPSAPRLVEGYMTDEAATLEVEGIAGDGQNRRWVFVLERGDDDGWRISHEWDPGPGGMRWE